MDDWPYLFMKIEGVKEITTANFVNLDRINRAIGGAEVMDSDGSTLLAIDDVFGGQVNVVFASKHSILALNPDGSALNI